MMRQAVCGIGLSACLLSGLALSAARADDLLIAQAAPGGRGGAPAVSPGQQVAAAPAAPQIPVRTEILNFDGWTVTCAEFAEGPRSKRCSALLQILQQNTGQVVFTWSVGLDERKQLVAVIQTPTGVAIPPGVELRIGKLPPQKIPFASCEPNRCVATMTVDSSLQREMTASASAEAVIQATQGNTVQFNIQMKGFDRAYAALTR